MHGIAQLVVAVILFPNAFTSVRPSVSSMLFTPFRMDASSDYYIIDFRFISDKSVTCIPVITVQ